MIYAQLSIISNANHILTVVKNRKVLQVGGTLQFLPRWHLGRMNNVKGNILELKCNFSQNILTTYSIIISMLHRAKPQSVFTKQQQYYTCIV